MIHITSPAKHQRDIIIIYTYVAPENSSIYTSDESNGIEILQRTVDDVISQYPNTNIMLAGDFNARTSNHLDYITNDDISFIFNDNMLDYPSDNFDLDRCSKDRKINKFGLSLLDMCCTRDLYILNGRLFNDKDGNFTCFSNNGTSVVDYIICSTDMFKSIRNFGIGDEDFSDHFPLYCTVELNTVIESQPTFDWFNEKKLIDWSKMKWKPNLKEQFIEKFTELFQTFIADLESNDYGNVVQTALSFINLFHSAGNNMRVNTYFPNIHIPYQPKWWDNDCHMAKKEK